MTGVWSGVVSSQTGVRMSLCSVCEIFLIGLANPGLFGKQFLSCPYAGFRVVFAVGTCRRTVGLRRT